MKIKQIIFCTLRDNRGATGGPGGVLYIQKNVLGNEINKVPCKYQFVFRISKQPKITRNIQA